MITKFKNSFFSLENICSSILMLFAYSLLLRNPLVGLLNAGGIVQLNLKKYLVVTLSGVDVLFVISLSVALIIYFSKYKVAKEIELHSHNNLNKEKIIFSFEKKEYGICLLNSLNPFLLGSKTVELRE